MSARAAAVSFALLTCGYLVALVWFESQRNLAGFGFGGLVGALPALLTLTTIGWIARFTRWHWLMRRSGHLLPVVPSSMAYVAGFAFTATPGKVGELVRVRYYAAQGVPAWNVLAAFVYERACDLVVVLLLAMAAFQHSGRLRAAGLFGVAVVLTVMLLAFRPTVLSTVVLRVRQAGLRRLARLLRFLRDGLVGCRQWLTPLDLLLSTSLALCAWSTTSLTLVWLVHVMGFSVSTLQVFAIYPLAMLVGAASMLPGGVGTTEATIVALLAAAGVPWDAGVVAALGVRLVTLWLAVATGLLALAWLEYHSHSGGRPVPVTRAQPGTANRQGG